LNLKILFKKKDNYKMTTTMVCCSICTEDVLAENIYICKNTECNLEACIECYKKYLLGSAYEPSCMQCKTEIPLDVFVSLFPKKWRLKEYKEHTKNLLWSKEQSKMNETQNTIEDKHKVEEQKKMIIDLKEEIALEKQKHKEIIDKLKNDLYDNKEILYAMNGDEYVHTKNEYKYKCPNAVKCNGSLNNKFECILCDNKYCKDCFEVLDKDIKIEHICNEDLKKTIGQIKKEAKPCSCGEMISKINGCDQIFCTKCGNAFSWNTGKIEKGIIHNPHAAKYFQDNPEAKEKYLERINNINNDNNDDYLEQTLLSEHLRSLDTPYEIIDKYILINRCVYNNENLDEPNEPDNNDYRVKWLRKEIDDDSFKKIIFTRYKKYNKNKMDYEVIKESITIVKKCLLIVLRQYNVEAIINILENQIEPIIDYMNEQLNVIG
jgi:hypothetical protein